MIVAVAAADIFFTHQRSFTGKLLKWIYRASAFIWINSVITKTAGVKLIQHPKLNLVMIRLANRFCKWIELFKSFWIPCPISGHNRLAACVSACVWLLIESDEMFVIPFDQGANRRAPRNKRNEKKKILMAGRPRRLLLLLLLVRRVLGVAMS